METLLFDDEYFMNEALKQARIAFEEGEIPIGAVVVSYNRIIGKGYNQTERLNDVTAHAEMLAITAASHFLNGKYLENCKLYVTIEPCPMCAGAIQWSRAANLIYGAPEKKFGYGRFTPSILSPKIEVVSGVKMEECQKLMQEFFREKR